MQFNTMYKWSRIIHRDISFFFAGMLLIYAISGIAMNHESEAYHPKFSFERKEYSLEVTIPKKSDLTKAFIINNLLEPINEAKNYAKHHFPTPNTMKIFLKGGSNLSINMDTQKAVYEVATPRNIVGTMVRIHDSKKSMVWWKTFVDITGIGIIVIIISGLLMLKGHKGLFGRGGLELLAGMIIPLAFLFF